VPVLVIEFFRGIVGVDYEQEQEHGHELEKEGKYCASVVFATKLACNESSLVRISTKIRKSGPRKTTMR
jgi:hypothetical protein